jgi:hypothetical protein
MVRSLTALAIFLLLGASVLVLPGFAPKVEAGEVAVLAKADRLDARAASCSAEVWPDFSTSCLRNPGSGVKILDARMVSGRR